MTIFWLWHYSDDHCDNILSVIIVCDDIVIVMIFMMIFWLWKLLWQYSNYCNNIFYKCVTILFSFINMWQYSGCDSCGDKFTNKSPLARHLKTSHYSLLSHETLLARAHSSQLLQTLSESFIGKQRCRESKQPFLLGPFASGQSTSGTS